MNNYNRYMTEMYAYIDGSKEDHLTLGDIRSLKVGDTLDVVVWDRNWEETGMAWTSAVPGKTYAAEEFFKDNRVTLTYKGNMKWDIHFSFGETFEHPVHLDVSHYHPDRDWIPISDGTDVRIDWCENCSCITDLKDCNIIKLEEVSDMVRVGWRGPMMLWSKVKGQVYYPELELIDADDEN